MTNGGDDEGFRFIGTEIENLIAKLEKETERAKTEEAKAALRGAINQLKETVGSIHNKYFAASWFLMR